MTVQNDTGTDSKTILLVEDEAIIALGTKATLESWGYSVVLASSGETAVSTALATPEIDLVLMDIDLGTGIDGTEAAQRILAARNLPIVFVSSHTEESLVEKVRGITRYGFVVKASGDFVLRASIEMAFELFDAHQREQAHLDRYQAVINSLPDLMFVLSGDGTFQEAYAPPTHSTVVPIEEIPGMRLHEAFGVEEAERHLAIYRTCLETGETQTFDYQMSSDSGTRHFEARISKAGEDLVLAIVREVTEERRTEAALERKTRIQRALVDVATRWINLPPEELPSTIDSALGGMAEAIGADRAYVFAYDFGRDVATNTFEWCAPGIAPHIENLQALPLESIGDAVKLHRRGEAHHIPDVSDLQDQQLRTVLQEQGIQSLLTVPLFSGGECSGSVGFDFVRCRHLFSEEEHGLLAVFGELLAGVWERQAAEERFRVFFDAARDNIMIHEVGSDGLPGNYIDVNRSTCETLGYSREELLSMSPVDTSDGLDEEEIRAILASLAEGESVLFEATGRRKDGTTIPFELNLYRLTLQGRDTVVAVSRDVSARKRQETMQRQITELAPAAIYVFDHTEGRLVFANSEYEKQLGYTFSELQAMGETLTEAIYHPDAKERLFELDKNIAEDRAGKIFESEYKVVRKDGRSRWGYVRETVLTRKPDGTPEQVIGAGIDITDRKAAEGRIAGLLNEKELLLTEVHHRIKNNMTTMVSLLSLQASASTEPQVKQALTEAQSRMQSMTLLYEKLYRSESVSEISISEYLPSLVTDLVSTYGADRRVALEIEVEEFTLPVSLVTALGIIVNEVVTNALKYAFPDGGEGAISVKAEAGPGPGGPVVTIVDDGVGLPPSVGLGESGGFGLTLVATLAEQYGFDVSIERSGGTRFVIAVEEQGDSCGS